MLFILGSGIVIWLNMYRPGLPATATLENVPAAVMAQYEQSPKFYRAIFFCSRPYQARYKVEASGGFGGGFVLYDTAGKEIRKEFNDDVLESGEIVQGYVNFLLHIDEFLVPFSCTPLIEQRDGPGPGPR